MDSNSLYIIKTIENSEKDNIDFPYPLAFDDNEDIANFDYNYNEVNFEEIDEELINEIDNFRFEK